jgi:APA family basic amino acid/polyamine antiporter
MSLDGSRIEKKARTAFVREATGLVRSYGSFDTWWIVSLGFGGSLFSTIMFFFAYFYVVGAGTTATILATFLALPLSLCVYWPMCQMSIAMPRSGGDYVYVSRSLHPAIGFMNNFVFTAAALIGLGISVPWVVSLCLTGPLYMIGLQTGNTSLAGISNFIGQPWPGFLLGALILGVVFVVLTFGPTAIKIFNRFQLVVVVILFAILFYGLVWIGSSGFSVGLSSVAPQTNVTVDRVFQIAKSTGWPEPDNGLRGIVSALPLTMFVFYGMAFGTYFAGEVKNIAKTQPRVIWIYVVTNLIAYVVIEFLLSQMFGERFFSAVSWITFGPGGGSSPWPVLMPSTVLMFIESVPAQLVFSILVAVNWVVWFLFFWIAASRSIFAWSFDRVIPEAFCRVSDRFKSPVYTGLTVLIFALIFEYLFVFTPLFTGQFNFLMFLTSALIIPSIAAAVFPYRKPDLFKASHKIVRTMVGRIPLITILGTLAAFIMFFVTIVFLQLPFLGPANPVAFAFFIGLYITGLVVYYISKAVRKRQGIDLSRVFLEVPPE